MLFGIAHASRKDGPLSSVAVAAFVAAGLVNQAEASSPHFDVTISTAATHNMSFSGAIYSPTGSNAVLNVSDLANALANGAVEVTTGNSSAGLGNGDLHVDARLAWSSANMLTLDAYHEIFVDQPISDVGAAAMILTSNNGGSGDAILYRESGSITIRRLSDQLTINGKSFTLVGNISQLAKDIAENPSGAYALANAYDASNDGTYSASPVQTTFAGVFDGLGNTISHLKIVSNSKWYVGLMSNSEGIVENLRLSEANILESSGGSIYVGGVAGYNSGMMLRDQFSGRVVCEGEYCLAGGMAGWNDGTINWSVSEGAVKQTTQSNEPNDDGVGGLVGVNGHSGEIENS